MSNLASTSRVIVVAIVLSIFSAPGLTTAGEVDVLAISHDFNSLPRTHILVVPVPQPPKPDAKLKIADSLGTILTEELVAALQRVAPTAHVESNASESRSEAGLVLEAYFSKLVPGSRAKRFWLGFGAGKAITEISGEVRDGPTGRVVARFTHARLSWCCGFGDNDHEIRGNLVNAAEDIAGVVVGQFDSAQSYTWLQDTTVPPEQSQNRDLVELKGHLVIEASVEHAEVLIDGKYLGTTPLELTLEAGSHKVTVRKAGFLDWIRDLEVINDSSQRVWASLEQDQDDQ